MKVKEASLIGTCNIERSQRVDAAKQAAGHCFLETCIKRSQTI